MNKNLSKIQSKKSKQMTMRGFFGYSL